MLFRSMSLCLDAFLPKRCAGCETPVRRVALCPPCAGSLLPGDEGACPQCGAQDLERGSDAPSGRCGPCLTRPPSFLRARGAYAYGGALSNGIRRWKSRPEPTLSQTMCDLFQRSSWSPSSKASPSKVLLVPPDPRRLRARGFHPAGLLARAMARRLALPVDPFAVRANASYPISRGQSREQRRERLRGVFRVESDAVRDQRILLVDDVMTTGATVETIARGCLRAGASSVEVVVLARAPR